MSFISLHSVSNNFMSVFNLIFLFFYFFIILDFVNSYLFILSLSSWTVFIKSSFFSLSSPNFLTRSPILDLSSKHKSFNRASLLFWFLMSSCSYIFLGVFVTNVFLFSIILFIFGEIDGSLFSLFKLTHCNFLCCLFNFS